MRVSENSISIRTARSSDSDVAINLIMMAAKSLLVTIFGNGDEKAARAFLKFAWQIEFSQFGYGQHTVICINDKAVGICTNWQRKMPDIFAKHTAQSIVGHYTNAQAQQVIERSKKATYAILVPPEDAMVIGHVAILPEYRRTGLAQRLINHMSLQAKQQGKIMLVLDVEQKNTQAIAFYEQIGFAVDTKGPDRSPFQHMTKLL